MRKFKLWYPLLAVLMALALAALACGGGSQADEATATKAPTKTPQAEAQATDTAEPEATSAPKPTKTPQATTSGEIEIRNSYSYIDNFDYVHVVGELFNGTDEAITNVELAVQITDSSGNSILTDSDGNPTDSVATTPHLFTTGPGESTTFDYYASVDNAEPSEYHVEVTNFETGEVNRADVEVQNAQLVFDSDGNGYLAGELVNLGGDPATISGIAGAALDADGLVLAADYTFTRANYLAPAGDESGKDRTPFIVTLDGPMETAEQWSVVYDVDVTTEADPTGVDLELGDAYFSSDGQLHVLGVVTNNGDSLLNIALVAGLYAEDGTVLDAATLSVPIYVESGETAPFSFDYFPSINTNEDEANRVDSYTVQVDPFWTFASSSEVVALETTNDEKEDQGDGVFRFAGDVENTSDQELSSMTVILSIYGADGNLVATQWGGAYPEGDSFRPGDSGSFEIYIYLDPDADTEGHEFTTIVQGYVK